MNLVRPACVDCFLQPCGGRVDFTLRTAFAAHIERTNMAKTPKNPPIHPVVCLTHFTARVVVPMLDASFNGLQAHMDIFSHPPIDLNTYGGQITSYKNSIPAANDGSKSAVAVKNKLRTAVTRSYVQLAHYAANNCNDD